MFITTSIVAWPFPDDENYGFGAEILVCSTLIQLMTATVFFCTSIHLYYPHPVPSVSGFNSCLGNPSKIAMLIYKHADIGRVRNLWGCLV
jgi:hypothetical protein